MDVGIPEMGAASIGIRGVGDRGELDENIRVLLRSKGPRRERYVAYWRPVPAVFSSQRRGYWLSVSKRMTAQPWKEVANIVHDSPV